MLNWLIQGERMSGNSEEFLDACSQTQTTEIAVPVLLHYLNAGYRIILSRSSPTPKRVREMEQESEPIG
jgi:3-methyladenine DNA glycosylase AlkC